MPQFNISLNSLLLNIIIVEFQAAWCICELNAKPNVDHVMYELSNNLLYKLWHLPWQLYQHARFLLRYFLWIKLKTYTPDNQCFQIAMHLIIGIISPTKLWMACCFYFLFLTSKYHIQCCLWLCTKLSSLPSTYSMKASLYTKTHSHCRSRTHIQTHRHVTPSILNFLRWRQEHHHGNVTVPLPSTACFKRWEDGRQQEMNRV